MKKQRQDKQLTPVAVCGEDGAAVRELMTRIGDKWSIFLIVSLSKMPKQRARFSELEKTIPGVSQRMLSHTLKHLERDGMVTREVFPEVPPRVEYELTALGRSLFVPMQSLIDWVGTNWTAVKSARAKFESKKR